MPANIDHGSAKIFKFPARGRFAPQPYPDFSRMAADHAVPGVMKTSAATSWYHDEAVREADLTRKN